MKGFRAEHVPFLPLMMAWMIRLLHRTCHFTVIGREYLEESLRAGPSLATMWHFTYPTVMYFFRNYNVVVMASRSRDGEWVARVLEHLGFQTARGSQGKGGGLALRKMLSYINAGHNGGLIADGSRGPACVAQKGILLLARYSGAPLLPVSMAAHPSWRFRSWDRTVLAKPFSRVVVNIGSPIKVDRRTSSQQLEEIRKELEERLNELTQQACTILGQTRRC